MLLKMARQWMNYICFDRFFGTAGSVTTRAVSTALRGPTIVP